MAFSKIFVILLSIVENYGSTSRFLFIIILSVASGMMDTGLVCLPVYGAVFA